MTVALLLTLASAARAQTANTPGCERKSPIQCLNLALQAMGGRQRLLQVHTLRFAWIGHTLLMEQSYRQEPFITSYERATTTLDLVSQRTLSETRLNWPESDDGQSESSSTVVTGPEGGVRRRSGKDGPCSLADMDEARNLLALGPWRVLLTAAAAPDLRFDRPEWLRSSPHSVLVFSWRGLPVRLLLNRFNHLPDAIETTRQFHDFWFIWGDVMQRVYFDNWKLVGGLRFPTNWVEQRNGAVWRSRQLLQIEVNPPVDESALRMDASVARASAATPGWDLPFHPGRTVLLAPGITFLPGPWNSTIVAQSDGTIILEAPISGRYTQGIIAEAKKLYPTLPVKAVLSTSDSWPHIAGLRYVVSQRLPIYILDRNQPLLARFIRAPHALQPDELQTAPHPIAPDWKIVSGKFQLGSGANRVELYPLRGASTGRQYMVFFPERHLLYASDTLAMNGNGSLYDPELMSEVVQAVQRERLQVKTVFAMHQGPTDWNHVLALIEKARHS